MLRITVRESAELKTIQLEGTLVGPWAQEVHDYWQGTLAVPGDMPVRFDLSGVTSIDAAGKRILASVYSEGAELVACGCMMRAIVAEVKGEPIFDCGCG
jgi:anti-anti-sigma regulatory factor